MARRARTTMNFDAVPSVNLFVVSTGWPYKPTWAAEEPTVFLTGCAAAAPGYLCRARHVCARYLPLLRSVLDSTHESMFIVDLSSIASPAAWKEELEQPGRATKMLAKWLVKFNARHARFVVHAEDARVLEAALKLQGGGHVPEEVVSSVLVTGDAQENREVLLSLGKYCQTFAVRPSLKAVKLGLNKKKQDDVSAADLFIVALDFKIDATLKQLVQEARDISAQVLCERGPVNMTLSTEVGSAAAAATVDCLEFGGTFTGLHVQVLDVGEAGDMMQVTLADPHASIQALIPDNLRSAVCQGSFIKVAGQVAGLDGRMVALVSHAEDAQPFRHGYTSVRLGQRDLSRQSHRIGVLVVRGQKCALQRKGGLLQIPTTTPSAGESKLQTATRAASQSCKIYAEEIAILQDIPPAVAYESSQDGVTVVTIFVATATQGKAEEGGCGCGPTIQKTEPYEWCSCEEALGSTSDFDRKCILKIIQSVAEAAEAGVIGRLVEAGVDQFRLALPAALNELSFPHAVALMDVAQKAALEAGNPSPWYCTEAKPKKKGEFNRSWQACCPGGKCGKKGCC